MASSGKNIYRASLRYPAVRWLTLGYVQSRIGDYMYGVAIVAVVFTRTHSPVDVTIAAVAMRLPLVVLPPLAGVLVDRSDRRKLMLALDVVRGVLVVLMAVVISAKAPVGAVVALAVLVAAVGTAYGPAETALVATVVSEDDLGAVNAMSSSIESLTMIAGPALGALVLVVGSASAAMVINAITFGFSAACLSRVASPPRPERSEREAGSELLAGFVAIRRDGALAVVTLALVACCVGVGSVNVLFLLVSGARLGTGTHGLGYLLAAAGVGGFVAASFCDRLTALRRIAVIVVVLLVASGGGLCLLAATHDLAPACLIVAVWGAAYLLLEVLTVTLLQRCVDGDLLGRASAAVDVLAFAGVLLGGAITGPVAEHVGLDAAALAVGAPSLAAALVIALRARDLDARADAAEAALAPALAVLEAAEVFAGVGRAALESLAAVAVRQPVAEGAVIVRQGEPADDLYVVTDGSFEVTSSGGRAGRPARVRTLGPGDVFGEIGVLGARPRTATVTAISPGSVYRVPGADFLEVVAEGGATFAALRDLAGTRLLRTHRGLTR